MSSQFCPAAIASIAGRHLLSPENEIQAERSRQRMSPSGQKQTSPRSNGMSALPPKADIAEHNHHVRFVPIADINISLAVSAGWVILLAVGP
jgi:hypothetical protein